MQSDRRDTYFEIFDTGCLVRLEPLKLIKYESDIDWDKNWINTVITINGGKFSGTYNAEIMTVDFEKFKQELSLLYDNLKGIANFKDLEGYLELKISGDGFGHFEVAVKACDKPGIDASELTFTMAFDQTEIKELVRQLDIITKQFPITGDFNIKNE